MTPNEAIPNGPRLSGPAERNKQPILEMLTTRLSPNTQVLELACGTLQHALHFTAHLPDLSWQPTDLSTEAVEAGQALVTSKVENRVETVSANLKAPLRLDVLDIPWSVPSFDTVYTANLLHISPIEVVNALFAGASQGQASRVFIYGPFLVQGHATAQGNIDFDTSLRQRNPSWGIRQLSYVTEQAQAHGYTLKDTVLMPANNLFLEFSTRSKL